MPSRLTGDPPPVTPHHQRHPSLPAAAVDGEVESDRSEVCLPSPLLEHDPTDGLRERPTGADVSGDGVADVLEFTAPHASRAGRVVAARPGGETVKVRNLNSSLTDGD